MKEEVSKNQNQSQSTNPFLSKPLKSIKDINKNQGKPVEINKDIKSISEHRASKFLNLPNTLKSNNLIFSDKKNIESPNNLKINNIREKNNDNNSSSGFKSILNKFSSLEKNKKKFEKNEENKKFRKRASVEKYLNLKIQENFRNANEVLNKKNYNTNHSDNGEMNENDKEKTKIQVSKKENFIKKEEDKKNNNDIKNKNKEGMYFKNDEEILKYIKNKVKEGKIKDIYQQLELKKNDFTGFSLCKKNKGYITDEIQLEDDIKKINEIIKNKKIQIKNKQVEFVYSEDLELLIKNKKEYEGIKENSNIKNENEKQTEMEKIKDKIKNKAIESQNIKNEKMNNEIKNLQNKICKYKEELKENDKELTKKINNNNLEQKENNKLIVNNIPLPIQDNNKTKVKENLNQKNNEEENAEIVPDSNEIQPKPNLNKRVSKAYNRFKRACSLHKEKGKKGGEKNATNNDKIQSLASMLKDHIIKPLAEIQEENEGGGKMYRGGSVECKNSKMGDEHFIQLLQNAPITKKKVKKPKLNNFVE